MRYNNIMHACNLGGQTPIEDITKLIGEEKGLLRSQIHYRKGYINLKTGETNPRAHGLCEQEDRFDINNMEWLNKGDLILYHSAFEEPYHASIINPTMPDATVNHEFYHHTNIGDLIKDTELNAYQYEYSQRIEDHYSANVNRYIETRIKDFTPWP